MRYDPVIQQTFGVVLCRKDRNRLEPWPVFPLRQQAKEKEKERARTKASAFGIQTPRVCGWYGNPT